jgi:death-on-curing protein
MKQPQWVLRDVVLALQDRLLSEFGGLSGLRDAGLFDSALARPEQLLAYGKPSLQELAAAYAYGLIRNHPFNDGNKRIGFTTAALFLELNGLRFTASEVDSTVQTLALAAREIDEAEYSAWLSEHSVKIS